MGKTLLYTLVHSSSISNTKYCSRSLQSTAVVLAETDTAFDLQYLEESIMSSLQQALDNAANRLKLKKLGDNGCNNKQKKSGEGGGGGGAFENSFAQGLDISEFLSNPNQRTSAAEELLKIKEGERRQRQIQEEEEAKMEEALQKRLNSLKEQNAINNKAKEQRKQQQSVFEIGDALLRMHGTDERATAMLSQKANTRKAGAGNYGGTANSRRNSASRRTSHNNKVNNKSSLAKKSRKSKF